MHAYMDTGALLIVLISCYPKVQHSVRDGLLRLLAAPGQTTDLVPFRTLAACTAGIVALSTVIGTLVNKVEVVLAYKGAIFGSLMVYVSACMHIMHVTHACRHACMHVCLSGQRSCMPPSRLKLSSGTSSSTSYSTSYT